MLSASDEAEWAAALAHAVIRPECARHWVMDELGAETGAKALWFPPGDELPQDDEFPDADKLAEANSTEDINLHRIALRPFEEVAVLAATRRHELEHARQYDELGPKMVALHRLVRDAVLAHRARMGVPPGDLINSIPTELDANAAASMYLYERHPDALADLGQSDEHRPLVSSKRAPEPLDTLPARMVAFAYIHRGCMHDETASGMTLEDELNECYEGAWDLWQQLDARLGEPWASPPGTCR